MSAEGFPAVPSSVPAIERKNAPPSRAPQMLLGLSTPASRRFLPEAKFTPAMPAPKSHFHGEPLPTASASLNPLVDLLSGGQDINVESLQGIQASASVSEVTSVVIQGLNLTEPLLPSRRHLIQQLFSAVDYADDLNVSSAALNILTHLSDLPQFEPDSSLDAVAPNRLFVAVSEASGLLEDVRGKFRRRLEREETENIEAIQANDLLSLHKHVLDWERGDEEDRELVLSKQDVTNAFGLTNLVRLQIVGFLERNVNKPVYNMAHFVLGFPRFEAMDAADIDEGRGCLSLLVDMLEFGLGHPSTLAPALFIEHPSLAVTILRLLATLWNAPGRIGSLARTYLRDRRQIPLKLAALINTRLLQYEDVSDELKLQLSWLELAQKTFLFSLLASDLHDAVHIRHEQRYAEQLIRALAFSSSFPLSELHHLNASAEELDLNLGEDPKCLEFLGSVESLFTLNATLGVPELATALSQYVKYWSALASEILASLEAANELAPLIMVNLPRSSVDSFAETMQTRLWAFLMRPELDPGVMEDLCEVALLAMRPSQTLSFDPSLINAMLRSDLLPSTRCMFCAMLMARPWEGQELAMSDEALSRVVDCIAKDATTASGVSDPVSDSVVSVALTALQHLHQTASLRVSDTLLASGFFLALLPSFLVDDARVAEVLASTLSFTSDLSIFIKWRAKWSLLVRLVSVEGSEGPLSVILDTAGFFSAICTKLRCLTLSTAYRLADSPKLVLEAVLPVLKFLAALAINPERREYVAEKLVQCFRDGELLETFVFIMNHRSVSSGPDALMHSQATKAILTLLNTAAIVSNEPLFKDGLNVLPTVLQQLLSSIWTVHSLGRTTQSLLPFVDGLSRRTLKGELEVLDETVDFLLKLDHSRAAEGFLSDELSVLAGERTGFVAKLTLGTCVFLLQTALNRIKDCREQAELVSYYARNLDSLSAAELQMIVGDDWNGDANCAAASARLSESAEELVANRRLLVNLFEKTLVMVLAYLQTRLKATSTFSDPGQVYSLSRVARSLRTDASVSLMPLLEAYKRSLGEDSSPTFSGKLIQSYYSLLKPSEAAIEWMNPTSVSLGSFQ